jgi:hypothetical protein
VYRRTGTRAEPGRLSALFGIVADMARRILDRTYRSTAELMRAIRDEHVLTQHELAGRTGLSRYPPQPDGRDSARSYGKSDHDRCRRRRSRGCANPTCPSPPSTALPARSGCWPATATT